MVKRKIARWLALLALGMGLHGSALAMESAAPEDEVFVRAGDTVITQGMLDAAFSRIPERDRPAFIRDDRKVDVLVKNLLSFLTVADAARVAGFDRDPLVQHRMQLAADKELAEAWLEEQVRQAPDADYEGLARESYVLNESEFMEPGSLDVSHLLISTKERSEEEAERLAGELLAQLRANPARFDELVMEYSEDPSVVRNQGRFKGVKEGDMVAPFEAAAMALENPGDISDLARTQFGYHIIRLDGRTPPRQQTFEEVRDLLVENQKAAYQQKVRSQLITDAITEPPEVPEGAVEKMLKRWFGENYERAPNRPD